MNYKIISKSNNLISLHKVKNSHFNKFRYKLIKVLQKLTSISNYIFKNQPYLFDDYDTKRNVYIPRESYCYKSNTDLKLIEVRRTFL